MYSSTSTVVVIERKKQSFQQHDKAIVIINVDQMLKYKYYCISSNVKINHC